MPAGPHAFAVVGETHIAPEQQPFGQVVGLQPEQVPPLHESPPGQAVQGPPPVPQADAELPFSQVLPAQQPVGQLVESQMQLPSWQRWAW